MKHTTTKQNRTRKPATPGFAIEIKDDTELCDAMLIAEDEYSGPQNSDQAIS